jgi:hypothetical protein
MCPTAKSRVAVLLKADVGRFVVAWKDETMMMRDGDADLMSFARGGGVNTEDMAEMSE